MHFLYFTLPPVARADEPFARSRDYELQNIRTHLWFDVDHRSMRGEVTESIASLRENLSEIKLDSVDLKINSVTVDGEAAKFSVEPMQLIVSLVHPAKVGERHQVVIKYEGTPKKGLYFVLPDKNYPQQPQEIWTQGEAEDTRYYIPLYDYPNNRLTSEMLLTVPASWLTISNGKLLSVKDEPDGLKTWDWKQSEPLSSYLITAIAGEFVEHNDTWRGVPLRYVVPRGQEFRIEPTFARSKQMLDLFSDSLGVPYPWAQYAQTSVDGFIVGGMENTSATTLTTHELENPALAAEDHVGGDTVDSHELAHQWFGDLVTTKDWANLWLNEGFATYFEHYWMEHRYGADEVAYEFWRDQAQWFNQKRMFGMPIVNRNFTDSMEYAGNIYTKGGLVLKMLRHTLGDENFFRSLHNYLETNRGQNVVTADLQKAIEQTTSMNVDKFFEQWVYRAGAPQFDITYSYDDTAHQVSLAVKQTQKVEGLVGLFDVPVEVEIATATTRKTSPIEVSEAEHTFTFPADSAPLMVLFDKGNQVLKSVTFQKDPAMLIYQLKNAEAVPDRADAASALGNVKGNADVVAALGDAALHDPFWGVRVESLRALGKIGGADSEKQIMAASDNKEPWVRDVAVRQLGNFKDDSSLPSKLADISYKDPAFRVRAAALEAIAQIKPSDGFDTLVAQAKSDSPDNMIRDAALRGLGTLGDDKAVPVLLEWSAAGKPFSSRQAAISAVSSLDKKNKNITKALVSYLSEPYLDVRISTIFALGRRRDSDAITPLEDLLKGDTLTIGERSYVETSLSLLKTPPAQK